MTFLELQQYAYRRLNFADSPETAVATRIKQTINLWHHKILTDPGVTDLRDDQITFDTVIGQNLYTLPSIVGRIKLISERTTQRIPLYEQTLQWLRTVDPGLTSSGPGQCWIPMGQTQVQAQPANGATPIYVASSSAADTTQVVSVSGMRGQYPYAASATLSGTTRQQLGAGVSDVTSLTEFYMSVPAVGTVTLWDAALLGNALSVLPIGRTSAQYLTLQLWPTPSAVVTYWVDYTRKILEMTGDGEVPFLPDDYHHLLALGAAYEEYVRRNDDRSALCKKELDEGIRNLKLWVINDPSYRPIPGRKLWPRRSNLGGWYPAGQW